MAVDATGTPTALGIPTFNTAADNPSGKGTNAMMTAIDTLLTARIPKPATPSNGQALVYNTGTGVWESAFVKPSQLAQEAATDGQVLTWVNASGKYVPTTFAPSIAPSNITQGGATTGQALEWNGSAWAPTTLAGVGTVVDEKLLTASVPITGTTEGTATTVIDGNTVAYDGTKVRIEFWVPELDVPSGLTCIFVLLKDATVLGQFGSTSNSWGSTNSFGPKALVAYDTPSAATHHYTVAAFGNGSTAKAGLGGTGTLLNGFLRTTKA